MVEKYDNFVNGEWTRPASGEYGTSINPSNGEPCAETPRSTETDVQAAVEAAFEAFENSEWSEKRPAERTKALYEFADVLRDNTDSLARKLTLENGKPLKLAEGEFVFSADVLDYFAGVNRAVLGETSYMGPEAVSLTFKEPVGVCALITPWNFPISLAIWKMAPALAVGCTVVWKPSSYTPAIALELGKIIEKLKSLPKGVVNIISGAGSKVGTELVNHPAVNKIAFTGETVTGKKIMKMASLGLKRVSLECGGKSPNIVFSDADMEKALQGAFWAAFRNSGQACAAGSRLIIERSAHDAFLKRLVSKCEIAKVGDGFDPNTELGPLISLSQLQRVLGYVDKGRDQGARILCGGDRLTKGLLSKGFFMPPTVLDNATTEMTVVREEIFGPVVSVETFETPDEAVSLANATTYGLVGAVWTKDIDRAMRVSRRIRAGTVWINNYHEVFPEMPFGGYRESGIGREMGVHGLSEYLEIKHVNIDYKKAVVAWR